VVQLSGLPSVLVLVGLALGWQQEVLRQGGFLVVAVVLYFVAKALWRRYVSKEDQTSQNLAKQIEGLQALLRVERQSQDDLLRTENTAKHRALTQQQASREQELQALRSESVKVREQLERQLAEARADLERQSGALIRVQEARVSEAMAVVRSVEVQREANEILERLLKALAESNSALRDEVQDLRGALAHAVTHTRRADPRRESAGAQEAGDPPDGEDGHD